MKREEIERIVKDIIEERSASIDSLEKKLEDDLGLDSLDLVEIWMDVEEAFHIDIPDEEVDNFKTPKDIIDYVEKHEGKN